MKKEKMEMPPKVKAYSHEAKTACWNLSGEAALVTRSVAGKRGFGE